MKHDRATELARQQVALYTLGLLTQHEAHCFELHLEECQVCRREFNRLLLAASQIGLAASEKEPPLGFRERLIERIDSSTRSELLSDPPKEKEPALEKELELEKEPAPGKNTKFEKISRFDNKIEIEKKFDSGKISKFKRNPLFEKKSELGKKVIPLQAIAPEPIESPRPEVIKIAISIVVVVFFAFAIYAWQTDWKPPVKSSILTNLYQSLQSIWKGTPRVQSRLDMPRDEMADLRQQYNMQLENMDHLEKIVDLLRKPSIRIARLKGQPPWPHNTGVVFWDESAGSITVVGAFDPLPEGMYYHLWISTSSSMIPVGTLQSEWNGDTLGVLKFIRNVSANSTVTAIVTLESGSEILASSKPSEPWSASGRFE